jgi:hypothetical protein
MPTIEDAEPALNKPPPISKSDHLQPFNTSSNATTVTRPQPKFNRDANKGSLMSRNKAIGGGKLGKSTRGWGTLPSNVLQ